MKHASKSKPRTTRKRPKPATKPAAKSAAKRPARAAARRPSRMAKARPRPDATAAVVPEVQPAKVVVVSPAAATPPSNAATSDPAADGTRAVDTFLADATHPLRDAYAAVRKVILEVSPSISEGVKWNAPSFRTTDWFATFFMRDLDRVKIVFHLGGKKSITTKRLPVGAPEGMVEWLAPDRCMVTLADAVAVVKRAKALQAFARAWLLHV